MNALNIFIKLKEIFISPTNDLIKFWMSKVKVTTGRPGSESIHVDAEASNS